MLFIFNNVVSEKPISHNKRGINRPDGIPLTFFMGLFAEVNKIFKMEVFLHDSVDVFQFCT